MLLYNIKAILLKLIGREVRQKSIDYACELKLKNQHLTYCTSKIDETTFNQHLFPLW